MVNLLEAEADDRVWGMAYEIEDSVWQKEVQQQLDHREKGGYDQNVTRFYPRNEAVNQPFDAFDVIAYIGKVTDKQYAGPAPIVEMANTILKSVGPSGPNKEYLFNLASALRQLGIEDEHIFELEEAVKSLEKEMSCE